MTLYYLNREYSLRVYLSYQGYKMRLAVLQYGRPARIVADEDEVLDTLRAMKDQKYEGK